MDQRLNGANPLSYRGVNAYSPPEFVTHPRPPTVMDWRNFIIGTIWLDSNNNPPDNQDIYMLVSIKQKVISGHAIPQATWVAVGTNVGPQTLTGNDLIPVSPDAGLNIDLLSFVTGLEFNSDAPNNTLKLESTSGNPIVLSLSDDTGVKSHADILGDIAIKGTVDRISVTSDGVHTLNLDISGDIASTYQTNTGAKATPITGNLRVLGGNNILTSAPGVTDVVQIDLTTDVADTYRTTTGDATPAANIIQIIGTNGIATTGAGNIVTIDGSGAAAQMTFREDGATTAVSLANSINMIGGVGLTTTGNGAQNVTFDLDSPVVVANGGTGVQTLSAYSVICSGTNATNPVQNVVGLGTAGQILTSLGAAALPVWRDQIAEKGVWTPVLSFSGGTAGVIYNTQIGVYEAFDNLVYIECGVVVFSVGTSTGTCTITGIPYPCSVSHPINAVAMATDYITYSAGYTVCTASVIPGTSIIQLPQCGSGKVYGGSGLTQANWTVGIGGYAAISFALTYFRS